MARRVFALTLALLAAAPAAGHGISDRKRAVDAKIAELHANIAQARAREQELSSEIATVTARIRALESEVGDVSNDLEALEHDLALHQERLDRIAELFRLQTRRLNFLRAQYAKSVARLNRRLVAIYESEDVSTLEVVLSATSFSDLLGRLEFAEEISLQDQRIAREVGEAKTQVREARARTEQTRERVAAATRVIAIRTEQVRSLRDRLLASQSELSASRRAKRRTLTAVQASEREFVSEAAALAQVSSQLAATIQAAQASSASPASGLAPPAPSASGFIWPVSGPVTSYFGIRWGRLHQGIDISAPTGTPIGAAASGTVIYADWLGGYGLLVAIDHGGGLSTAYAHASSIAVGVGQSVVQGQVIAYVGCTGHCYGSHLHFEVRVNGTPVDPLGYL